MSGIAFKAEEPRVPVILFLGAGISFTSGVRTAGALKESVMDSIFLKKIDRQEIERQFDSENGSIQSFADYLQQHLSATARYSFKDEIARILYPHSPIISPEYRMLAFLVKKRLIDAVYTTNQDVCLERALDSQGILYNRYVYPYSGKELQPKANGNVDYFKLCGDIHTPYEMCFSTEELDCATKSPLFHSLLSWFNRACRIIFIGYSAANDPIGKALRRASESRYHSTQKATLFIVDIRQTLRHAALLNEDYGDCIYERNAEEYLRQEITDLKPHIDVMHALVDRKGFGGIQTYAYSLTELQKTFGSHISPSFFAARDFDSYSSRDKELIYGFSYDLAAVKSQTVKAICTSHPDVIHAHHFVAAHTSEALGVPCVLTSHSLESTELKAREKYELLSHREHQEDPFADNIKKYEELYFRQLSTILTLSEAHKQEFSGDVQPSVQCVAAPFIRPECFGIHTSVTSWQKREELNSSTHAPKAIPGSSACEGKLAVDVPTIAFFGRPDLRKGLHIFHQVVELLHNSREKIDFQVLYVGPSIIVKDRKLYIAKDRTSYDQSYYELYWDGREVDPAILERMYVITEPLDGSDGCSFREHQRNMYDYYLASDLILLPSSYETFGYVALEAMACRRPVVATKIDGLRYLLGNGRGRLVEIPADSPNIAETDAMLAQAMASAAKDILLHGAAAQIDAAKAWVDATYSDAHMKALADQMYGCYLNSVIHGKKLDNTGGVDTDSILSEAFSNSQQWDTLLTEAPQAYQTLREKMYPASKDRTEFYELFWNIAYWLKGNRSLCPEINMVSVKFLAEIITDVTRFEPKGET